MAGRFYPGHYAFDAGGALDAFYRGADFINARRQQELNNARQSRMDDINAQRYQLMIDEAIREQQEAARKAQEQGAMADAVGVFAQEKTPPQEALSWLSSRYGDAGVKRYNELFPQKVVGNYVAQMNPYGDAPTFTSMVPDNAKFDPKTKLQGEVLLSYMAAQGDQKAKAALDSMRQVAERKGNGGGSQVGSKQKLTPGQVAADRAFAKEYESVYASGGRTNVDKRLSQLEGVSSQLEGGSNITGPALGMLPDWLLSWTVPESISAREAVEEVAQSNLREILGGQFAQQEGEQLIRRAYNPRLSEAENKSRVDRLVKQIRTALEIKDDAARYWEENGTLAGWNGKFMTPGDIKLDGGTSATKAGGQDAPTKPSGGIKFLGFEGQ